MQTRNWLVLVVALAACNDDGNSTPVDGGSVDSPPDVDAPPGCDPATVLPSNYRPIAMTSMGAIAVTTTAEVTSGTVDATAGGISNAPDNPYLYLDLVGNAKVAATDLEARSATTWDIALKRSSLRINGGDSGAGKRTLAIVQAATLAEVTAGPASGYAADDFTSEDCMLVAQPAGEPMSAFGEWYAYDGQTHAVTPKDQVYVVEREDGSRTAFRIATYYGDTTNPMRGAFYGVEWKQLPPK
jgi:hypothetical protein